MAAKFGSKLLVLVPCSRYLSRTGRACARRVCQVARLGQHKSGIPPLAPLALPGQISPVVQPQCGLPYHTIEATRQPACRSPLPLQLLHITLTACLPLACSLAPPYPSQLHVHSFVPFSAMQASSHLPRVLRCWGVSPVSLPSFCLIHINALLGWRKKQLVRSSQSMVGRYYLYPYYALATFRDNPICLGPPAGAEHRYVGRCQWK